MVFFLNIVISVTIVCCSTLMVMISLLSDERKGSESSGREDQTLHEEQAGSQTARGRGEASHCTGLAGPISVSSHAFLLWSGQ